MKLIKCLTIWYDGTVSVTEFVPDGDTIFRARDYEMPLTSSTRERIEALSCNRSFRTTLIMKLGESTGLTQHPILAASIERLSQDRKQVMVKQ